MVQRLSAIYLGVYFIYLLGYFIWAAPGSHTDWVQWLSMPLVNLSLALFFLSVLIHAWIGVRDVVIDYVHPLGLRLTVLTLIAMVLLASGFILLRSLILVVM